MLAILVIFFFSGAASLLYEVVWMRELSLIFGVTTFATSTILAAFMGGLALGSFALGRYADRSRRPLRVYALLELGIGLYALIVHLLFDGLRVPYVALYRLDLPYTTLTLGRAALGAFVLLPPTVLMGGTLPVLAAFLIRRRGDVGRQIGLLYFVNTAGAVAGCTVAGFLLIEQLGLSATTRLAACANFALALASLHIDRRQPPLAARALVGPQPFSAQGPMISAAAVRVGLYAIAVSGFTALAYEVFWTRALLRYLYNSTYAFTTMLAVFLAGLALGSALHTLLPYRRSRPVLLFAALELGVGLAFLVSLVLFADLRQLSWLLLGTEMRSFGDSLLALGLRAAMILFLPAVLLGATLPLATQIVAQGGDRIGYSVGRVYGVNTIGAIAGSMAASFLLIPCLGMESALISLVGTNLMIAGALAAADFQVMPARVGALGAAAALLLAISVLMPGDTFRRTFLAESGSGEIVFYREGATDTVGVVEDEGQRQIVYEDLRGTAATWSYPAQYMLGHLPVLLHPGWPKRALHICFGVGNSLSAIAAHDTIEEIDNVELSPHILEAARYFWTNNDVLESEKVRTIIEDGRNFVMATDRTYDVISLEPPETFTAGVINLYTREFYEEAERRLADDGVIAQSLLVGESPLEEEKMLFRAFYEVFPNATVWQLLARDGSLLLLGAKRPLEIDYQLLMEKMSQPLVRQDLDLIQVRDPVDVLSMFVFDSNALADFVRGVDPVIDDRTVVDFAAPRHIGSGFGLGWRSAEAKRGALRPLSAILRRAQDYYEARRSVLPHVTNLGALEAKTLERQLRERRRPSILEISVPRISESDWNRWRE